ncbi:MAG: FkbM family methyltransferase [Chloroflexi bacterium]|nr:FkbM family methyltransferase [Chloroflexota bacterium]
MWLARRMVLLRLRGRVRHRDRFGLAYWLWQNTRAMGTPTGEPRTDDTGVLEQLRRVYSAIGRPGRVCISVDVGAYIGVISLAMARFGPSAHAVHSIEADDLNYQRLRLNVSGASGASISIHKTAVGNRVGTAGFTRNQDPGTNHLGIEQDPSVAPVGVYTVPITTLDAFAEKLKINEIDVLKIDVEGADLDVLRGAEGLLGNERIRAIIIEIPQTAGNRSEMNALLTDYGLSAAYIVRNLTELTPASEPAYAKPVRTPLNMLAVRADMAGQLGVGS